MSRRITTIIDKVLANDRVSTRELAKDFAVSEMTIRRDLDMLEDEGLVVRHYGGCTATELLKAERNEPASETNLGEKAILGKAAAKLVTSGQTVMLDVNSTDYEVASQLPNDSSITVVTSSLVVAQELQETELNVLLLGGMVKKQVLAACGPLTERLLSEFHVDVFITTCDGANSEEGFYLADVQQSSLQQAMMRVSEHRIVIAESDKFKKRALVRYADVNDIQVVISDSELPEIDIANLRERGAEVVIASNDTGRYSSEIAC